MVFSIFTDLCSHPHNLSLRYFYLTQKKTPCPIVTKTWETTNLFSHSIDLPILDFHVNGIMQN